MPEIGSLTPEDPSGVIMSLSGTYVDRPKEDILALFDAEVERFSTFMSTLGDWRSVGPLSKSERALIKSYLVHKFRGRLDGVR